MNSLLDNLLVAAALLASVVYALFALGPRALRRRALSRVAGWAARAPSRLGLRDFAARLGSAAAKPSGGCGGCGSEGGPAPSSAPVGESQAAAGGSGGPSGAEIKIPLASVGRRRR